MRTISIYIRGRIAVFNFLLLLLAGIAASMLPYVSQAAPPVDSTVNVAPNTDTLPRFVRKIIDAGNRDRHKSEESYSINKLNLRQRQIENTLLLSAQEAKSFLDNGPDLKIITKQIENIRESFEIVKDGVLVHAGTAQTDRNLSISGVILLQLSGKLSDAKGANDECVKKLSAFRIQFDSLLSDPAIYSFPHDSLLLVKYLNRLKVMAAQGDATDNRLNERLEQAQAMQNEIDLLLFQINGASDQIEHFRNDLASINFRREFADLWMPAQYWRPLSEIIRFSMAKEYLAMSSYVTDNLWKILIMLLLIGIAQRWLKKIRERYQQPADSQSAALSYLVLHKPVATSVIIIISIYQFAFINAPFFFTYALWTVQIVYLLLLLHKFIHPFWFKFWLGVSFFFLVAGADNFMLQASRQERWGIAICSFAGIVFGCYFLLSRKEVAKLKERIIVNFIRFMVVTEAASLVCNLWGRYNLGKTLFITGYVGMVTAILLVWTVRLINEVLAAASHAYTHSESRSSLINYNRVGRKLPLILNIALVSGWAIIIGRNFYFFRKISVPFEAFLRKKWMIGDYSFAINGMLLFIVIVLSALVLSRIVSFFADDANAEYGSTPKSNKAATGSWILLLRILIISTGLFLAFAASGLPLDKITIVLGALSVGIGLGLQGLVSNLVSGLIIAFERPVNVGDLVEINGNSGIMKSIGFRSSIVTLQNGASLIVPNSDLLSAHVTNWSLSHNQKKIDVVVGVAFGSDLEQVATLLMTIAEADPAISRSPHPAALAQDFGTSAIEFKLTVWIKHPPDSGVVTSNLITAIDKQFRQHGISIPLPQHDVRLKR